MDIFSRFLSWWEANASRSPTEEITCGNEAGGYFKCQSAENKTNINLISLSPTCRTPEMELDRPVWRGWIGVRDAFRICAIRISRRGRRGRRREPLFHAQSPGTGEFCKCSCEWLAEVPEMDLIEWSITMDRGLWRPSGIAHAEDLQSCADATEESTKAAAQIR